AGGSGIGVSGGGGGGGSSLAPASGPVAVASTSTPSVTLSYEFGAPAQVDLALAPASVPVGTTSTATATVTDADGTPVSDATVAFSSSTPGDGIGAVTNHGDGRYTATITAATTTGTSTITASTGAPALTDTATLTRTAGPAANVAVTLEPPSIFANGTSQSQVTAIVTDTYGNRVPGGTVQLTAADAGIQFSAVEEDTPGRFEATLTSSTTPGMVTITATKSGAGVSGQATLEQWGVNAPTITVTAPAAGGDYVQGSTVTASYSCADVDDDLVSCTGPVASGAALSTATVGTKTFTVEAEDEAGHVTARTVTYKVVAPPPPKAEDPQPPAPPAADPPAGGPPLVVPPPPATPRVTLDSVRFDGRRLLVRIVCVPGAPCAGAIRATAGRLVAARAAYAVLAGEAEVVRVRLTRAAARRLRRRGRLRVRVAVTVAGAPAGTRRVTLSRSR
ncbi:MAG TPA: Ig-like domain-containing protein, partial [Solirubrobacteraceae bacterium]|nr:Ig-like domain-containing protein [Solirubrobacteraceae bacterium]